MTGKKLGFRAGSVVLLATGCVLGSAAALAQPMEIVTVEAAREVIVGQTSSGTPIKEITIRSRVSYADLDLRTDDGVKTLEKRIRDTAKSTCNEIRVDLPAQGSSVEKCIRDAIDGAMAQANEAIAAKRAAPNK